MRPSFLFFLGALVCACAAGPSGSPDAGTTLPPDAGDTSAPDAGVAELPANPTLDQLAGYWETKLCWAFACAKHERQTPATCARAAASDEFPFDLFRRAQRAVADGRGTYDVAAGHDCAVLLRALDTSSDCYGPSAPTPFEARQLFESVCGKLVLGLVRPGEACAADAECDSHGACRFDYSPEGACQGTCTVYLPAGADCSTRPGQCEPRTTYCDGSTCVARQLKADGQFCFDAGECQSGKCFDYACKQASSLQGECATDADCASGLYCRALPPSTGRTGVCQLPASPGSACGYAVKCAGNQACAGYSRKYLGGVKDGVCQARPSDVGEPCVPLAEGYDFGDTGCYADLSCNPETRRCEEAPALGSGCLSPGARCGVDAWCDAGGVCRAKKSAGESAEGYAECLDAWNSYEKVCSDPAAQERCSGR